MVFQEQMPFLASRRRQAIPKRRNSSPRKPFGPPRRSAPGEPIPLRISVLPSWQPSTKGPLWFTFFRISRETSDGRDLAATSGLETPAGVVATVRADALSRSAR